MDGARLRDRRRPPHGDSAPSPPPPLPLPLLPLAMVNVTLLEQILERAFSLRPSILRSGKIEEASHGFMSTLLRVALEWPEKRDDLPASVVLKMQGSSMVLEAMDATMDGVEQAEREEMKSVWDKSINKISGYMHDSEARTYTLFKDCASPFKMPRCYYASLVASGQPVIVMEDVKDAYTIDVIDGFSEQQLYSIVDEIIKIQDYSFDHEEWRSIEMPKEREFMEMHAAMLSAFTTGLIEKHAEHSATLQLLQKKVIADPDWFFTYEKTFESREVQSVLVHGDMWSPQFLWLDGNLASIVDWQLVHTGALTEDLQHLLALCVPVDLRLRVTQPLLAYYYDKLSEKRAEKGKQISFSFEYLQQDYRKTLPLTAFGSVFAVSLWSNSPVLRSGSADDDRRVAEMERRVLAICDEAVRENGNDL